LPSDPSTQREFVEILETYCRNFVLINLRELSENLQEHSYHIKLVHLGSKAQLLHALGKIKGVMAINLLMQETALEQ